MDTTQWDASERKRKEQFIARYKDNPDVILCDSMPSIEYWFLLHYERTNRHFGTSNHVEEALKRYLSYEKKERFLANETWVQQLLADNKMQNAMENAQALGYNGESYTNIPQAIIFLSE